MAKRRVSYPFLFTVNQRGPFPADSVVEVDDRTGTVKLITTQPEPAPEGEDAAPTQETAAAAATSGSASSAAAQDTAPAAPSPKEASEKA